jgi:hypothetical protein
MIMKKRFTLGWGWELTPEVSLSARHGGIGIWWNFYSWSEMYPWMTVGTSLGPLTVKIDFVRPDDVALQMRAERHVV